jgi:hypothetical protein
MMHFSKTAKRAALAGLFGLGVLVAMASPALASRVYTQCARDGGSCWRVICDNDGDDCSRYRINTSWSAPYRDRDTYSGYRYDRGRYNHDQYNRSRYFNDGYRHWVCDRDGDDCHWSYTRW